jgi:Mg/Co/Ni transporter MgtE
MQSIKTILLFEAKYRHDVLGLSLDEIENQLKNYPTQDAEDLLKRLRNDIGTDTLNREDPNEDDVSVTEGSKEEYRDRFNKMLKDAGASNISELTPEKRKQFFMKLDKSWKSQSEKKVSEDTEIEWTDDVVAEFALEFAEFADVMQLVKKEIEVLEEADAAQALEEASKTKRTTVTRVTRQTKIDRAIGSLSVQYAKAVNDPMYKKFKKYKDKWMKFKERIQAKYKARVRTAARQGGGIAHLLKDKQKGGAQTGKTAPKKKK